MAAGAVTIEGDDDDDGGGEFQTAQWELMMGIKAMIDPRDYQIVANL